MSFFTTLFSLFFSACHAPPDNPPTAYGSVDAHTPEGASFFLDDEMVAYCDPGATDCRIAFVEPGQRKVSAESYDFGYVDFYFDVVESGEVFDADWTATAPDGDWFYGLDLTGRYWCDGGFYSANPWYTDIGLVSYDMDEDGLEELAITGLPFAPVYGNNEFAGNNVCDNGAVAAMSGTVADDLSTIVVYLNRCDGREDILNYERQEEEN